MPPAGAEARFNALLKEEWTWRLRELPRLASFVGERAGDHRLERMDGASRAARLARWQATRERLRGIDGAALSAQARVEAAVYAHQLDGLIAEHQLGGVLMPIDGDSAFFTPLTELWRDQPLDSSAQLQAFLARLAAIPQFFDDHIELMEEGRRAGLMPPAIVLAGRDAPIAQLAACAHAEQTTLFRPVLARLQAHPKLLREAQRLWSKALRPACQQLLRYLRKRYLPAARASTAARELPGGEAFYAARVRQFTTLDMSPEQVHELGLAEVERIAADLSRLQRECGHQGQWDDFLHGLRNDPRHYPRSGEALLAQASWIAKRVDGVLPRFFGHLPRQPFGVEPVPEAMAPFYTTGRYVPAPPGGTAQYWVNTHKLRSRALYALPALTLHEAMPGHHMQFALDAENPTLKPFRRASDLSAHSEGWALYAEFLGTEMGLYRTPLEALGRSSYEMWRACRLVADTGLHWLGWSREQACALLRQRTALSEHEIGTEVDRYIGWPGQALSYKMGEIVIRRLRTRWEQTLGSAFDPRPFHDRLLALGAVPLPCLERELSLEGVQPP
ncbi:MAG: DUF885 domain-containing protein [Burkholderiales bacterium]|nr:DUF885 domain-containing protein [Burkholderiales bacterium]